MSRKSLYDLLEVNARASQEAIDAAHERLAKKFDPEAAENRGRPDVAVKLQALKEAYAILSNPDRRRRYDQTHPAAGVVAVTPYASARDADQTEGFSTLSGGMILLAIIGMCGGFYLYHDREHSRAELERARIEAERKEAALQAAERMQTEALEATERRQQEYAAAAERARAERELRTFRQQVDQSARERMRAEQDAARRAAAEERIAEQRRMAQEREAASRARAEAAAAARSLRQREAEARYTRPSVVVIPDR